MPKLSGESVAQTRFDVGKTWGVMALVGAICSFLVFHEPPCILISAILLVGVVFVTEVALAYGTDFDQQDFSITIFMMLVVMLILIGLGHVFGQFIWAGCLAIAYFAGVLIAGKYAS